MYITVSDMDHRPSCCVIILLYSIAMSVLARLQYLEASQLYHKVTSSLSEKRDPQTSATHGSPVKGCCKPFTDCFEGGEAVRAADL